MIRILLSRKLGELRLTQADLARKTGIRPSTIGAYYNDLTERINLRHFSKICEVLNCDLSELLMYAPDGNSVVRSMSTGRIMSGNPTVDE